MSRIHCPQCGQAYDLTPEQERAYAGRTIGCQQCGRQFAVPALGVLQAQSAAGAASAAPLPPGANTGAAHTSSPQTAGLAVTSLITGIVGLFVPLVGIVGVVTGILALKRTRDPAVGGRGLAIAGISTGGAGILVWLCVISILIPGLSRSRATAQRVQCASNLRMIGQAALMYSFENRNVYPADLATILRKGNIQPVTCVCPATETAAAASAQAFNPQQHSSYVYVGKGVNAASALPDRVIAYEPVTNHGDGANFMYGDGHTEWHPAAKAQQLIADVQAGRNPPPAR